MLFENQHEWLRIESTVGQNNVPEQCGYIPCPLAMMQCLMCAAAPATRTTAPANVQEGDLCGAMG